VPIMPLADDFNPPHALTKSGVQLFRHIYWWYRNDMFIRDMQQYCQGLADDDKRWFGGNKHGNNLLHLAALYHYDDSVEWLRKRKAFDRLKTLRNSAGHKVLEALQSQLWMTQARANASRNRSFNCSQRKCLAMLDGIDIDGNRDQLKQFRYGCTCGQCTDGFASPRRWYLLARCAEDLEVSL
jgi:hypothetical protein